VGVDQVKRHQFRFHSPDGENKHGHPRGKRTCTRLLLHTLVLLKYQIRGEDLGECL